MQADRYAVAGNPVEHSRSPVIHSLFAQATGQSIDYGRLLCPLDAFKPTILAFAQAGAKGCNVTVPFKFEAFEMATRRSARAELAQAANTLRFDSAEGPEGQEATQGGWLADNTDGVGLVRDITLNAGVALKGQRILLLGAGGASAGVLGPLIEAHPAEIVMANRTVEKAQSIVDRHADWARQHGVTLSARPLNDPGQAFDVFINGTAASLSGSGIPVGPEVLRPGTLALDMMYGPAAEAFLSWAREHGAVGRDGLGMLVEQAAESFFIWRGVRPNTTPVLAHMRALVDQPKVPPAA